jgi:hypothetical protein
MPPESGLGQHYAGGRLGNVGCSRYRYSHLGLAQGRRVVGAVAAHRDIVAPFWNAFTSLYLSSGSTPAKTANCSGVTASGIGPGGQTAPSRPTARATIAAVAGASPVTITVRTPKCASP